MHFWVIVIVIFFLWSFLNVTLQSIKNIKEKKLQKEQVIFAHEKLQFEQKNLFIEYKKVVKKSLDILVKEKTQGFPSLATAIADFYENYDMIFAYYLESKPRPAYKQAEKIKVIAKEKKLFKKEFLMTKYIIEYYETLFPWLREYVGFSSDELIQSIYKEVDTEEDPVSFYITKSEFENLSTTERNQRALENYWKRDKVSWKIGRDYERYIGYIYETLGFCVEYHGIEKLKNDLGIDLICSNVNHFKVIQCKYWSAEKGYPIRENHITQLYGTTIKFYLDRIRKDQKTQFDIFPELLKQSNISPVLVTTAELSDTAKEFASILGIRVDTIKMDKSYPCIKCNINFQTNERIYHLPFDQQYDRTKIDITKGEFWVKTVKEAENLGFRRAWRWRPNNENIDT